jgi:hypothetical protein
MTQKNKITEELIDLTTCVFAAHGFSLYLTEQIKRNHKRIWTQKVKQTGKAFVEQLEKSVNLIWQLGDKQDLTPELGHQQSNTYELCESFLKISMRAERVLTPEARQLFENEHVELLKKWNLAL